MQHILVTGGAGFIGSHLVEALLKLQYKVIVIDNFDTFYSRSIKEENIRSYINDPECTFLEADICDESVYTKLAKYKIDCIVHLAAKAGVRPSIENPLEYERVNIRGTQLLLEFAQMNKIAKFVMASSSSVYGINKNFPWSESDHVLKPISPYAATKLSTEFIGNVYSELYDINFCALRFFTVYGPRQRPDLAIHKFIKKLLNNEAIDVYGNGDTLRDYTYVDDIVEGIIGAINYNQTKYEIFNLGNSDCISLSELLECIEKEFDKKFIMNRLPQQKGDAPKTFADITKAKKLLGYNPQTKITEGISKFKNWIVNQ